jgi:hypothetical protein
MRLQMLSHDAPARFVASATGVFSYDDTLWDSWLKERLNLATNGFIISKENAKFPPSVNKQQH